MTDEAPDDFLDATTAAEILGLGPSAVYHLAACGDLKVSGWPVKVRCSELAAYIERCRVRPG